MGNAMTIATFQPDGTNGVDTFLDNTSQGSSALLTMFWGGSGRVLIKFDVSSISADAICTSAHLSLWPESGSAISTWTAYSILSGNSGWNENATTTTKDGTNAWAGSASCSTAGTDYNATSIGTITWALNNNEQTFNLTPSTVQSWFGVSNSNYGIIMFTNASASNWSVSSSDAANSARRPKLTINYNPVTLQRRSLSSLGAGIGKRQVQP